MYQQNRYPTYPQAPNPNYLPQPHDPSHVRASHPSNITNQNTYVEHPVCLPQFQQMGTSYERTFPMDHQYPAQTDYSPTNNREYLPNHAGYPLNRDYPSTRMEYPRNTEFPPVRMRFPPNTDYSINRDYPSPTNNREYFPDRTDHSSGLKEYLPRNERDYQQHGNRDHYPADNREYSADNRNYPAGNTDYPADNRIYPADNRVYPAGNLDYSAGNLDYPAGNRIYPADNRIYPAGNLDYSAGNRGNPRQNRKSVPGPLDPDQIWDCFYCPRQFMDEVEREEHLKVCSDKPEDKGKNDLYESIDHPKSTRVLLIWKKEKATLETEVQFYINDGDPITLLWSDKELRFQREVQLDVGEHGGLLNVNDINLTANVHTFYVAPIRSGLGDVNMQKVEIEIDDEDEELLKKPELLEGDEVQNVEGKEGEGTKDAKTKKISRKKKGDKEPVPNPEVVVNEKQADAAKKSKPTDKRQDSLQRDFDRLREQNKKLNEENSKMKKQCKAREEQMNKIEAEREKLAKSGAELKKELETKAAVSAAKKQLDKAYGECKSNLEAQEKECDRLKRALADKENEKTDLSQQLASMDAISQALGNRETDQQAELVERREQAVALQSDLRVLERRLKLAEEERRRECDEQKTVINLLTDQVSLKEKICESLRRDIDAPQKGSVLTRDAAATIHKSQLPEANADGASRQETGGGEGKGSNELQVLKKQLSKVEKERDELRLMYNAAKVDRQGKNSKEKSKDQESAKKNKKDAPDSKIPDYFIGTIERLEREVDQLRAQLRETREQKVKLENEKDLMTQELNKLRKEPVPFLIQPLAIPGQSRAASGGGKPPKSPGSSLPTSPTLPPTPPHLFSSVSDDPEGTRNPRAKLSSLPEQPGDIMFDLPPPNNTPNNRRRGPELAESDIQI